MPAIMLAFSFFKQSYFRNYCCVNEALFALLSHVYLTHKSMKKIIFTILLATVVGVASAQFSQGRMLVGGDFSFSSNTEKAKGGGTTVTLGKTTTFELGPQFGYFIIDNLAIGAALDVSLTMEKPEDADNEPEITTTVFALSPFVRYYLDQGIFFQGEFNLGSGKTKQSLGSISQETKFGLTGLGLGVGYAYFLNDNVAVEPLIGYQTLTTTNKESDPESKFIDGGLFLRVGFQIYLGSK
jgi:outer membrane protein